MLVEAADGIVLGIHNNLPLNSMTLYFVLGAKLAPSSGELLVRISHDEYIDVYARDDIDIYAKDTVGPVGGVFEALNWIKR